MKIKVSLLLSLLLISACGSNDDSSDSPIDTGLPAAGSTTIDSHDCAAAAAAAEDFYLPPDPLPQGQPGDVIRCQPINTLHSLQATGTLVMYLSTDVHGEPIAVTGVVFDPLLPWADDGPRPLVGHTHGTYGQGAQCASSRMMADVLHYEPLLDGFIAYESMIIPDLLARGFAVAATDYQRFATPGVHSFLNRTEQAHANIDIVRAARRLPDTSLATQGPVAFMGYSQGGHAAAGTAELLPSYAPELDVVGVYAGAVPRSIPQLMAFNDGGAIMGVVGFYLNGLAAMYPEVEAFLETALNDAGKAMRAATVEQCALEMGLNYAFQQTNSFTVSGQSLPELLASPPLDSFVERDRMGTVAPTAPVLLAIGANDDVVPVEGERALLEDWCALGASVEYYELPLPFIPIPSTFVPHAVNLPTLYYGKANQWLQDRFDGKPFTTTCP
ncbi:MAG: lipase family protein [Nevskiales bacterium]